MFINEDFHLCVELQRNFNIFFNIFLKPYK